MTWQVHSLALSQLEQSLNVLWNPYLILRLVRWPRPRCGLVCNFHSFWTIAINDAAFSWLHKISIAQFRMLGSTLFHSITNQVKKPFLKNHTLNVGKLREFLN